MHIDDFAILTHGMAVSHMCTCTYAHTPLIPDPDVLTKDELTPLHIAACHLETEGACRRVMKKLLKSNGKSKEDRLKARDRQFWHTPLHMACTRANGAAVQVLLMHIQGMFPLVPLIAFCGLGLLTQCT